MSLYTYKNNATSTVATVWNSAGTATSLVVADPAKFPAIVDAPFIITVVHGTSKNAYTFLCSAYNTTTGAMTLTALDTIPTADSVFPIGSIVAMTVNAAVMRGIQNGGWAYGDIKLRPTSATTQSLGWYPCDGTTVPTVGSVQATRLAAVLSGASVLPAIAAPSGLTYYMFLGVNDNGND